MTSGRERNHGVDFLRGVMMLLMVMDHARDYQGTPGSPTDPMTLSSTPVLLFTMRWLSHFCAPVFTFLMGVSVSYSSAKRTRSEIARQLLIRGCILLVLEFTLVDWGWTFNPFWPRKFFQVIGALGVSMLAIGALLPLGRRWAMAIGATILALHNLTDNWQFPANSALHYVWSFVHQRNVLPLVGNYEVRTTYPFLPILAVALLGYGLGPWVEAGGRRLYALGTGLIVAFLILRLVVGYGDPHPFASQPAGLYSLFSVLNVTKYPLSLQFVCMTLGPGLIFLAWSRGRRFDRAEPVTTLGRVPMCFYVVHLWLLHILALVWALAAGFPPMAFDMAAHFGGRPAGFGFPLWQTLPFALLTTIIAWPLCRRYDVARQSKRYPVLSWL
jgi:uncharacterized membrane protein